MSKVNLVNAYFDGELTKAQVTDFENQLKNDPELKQEFDFQKDIVEGLKEARRLELKTMLNNVSVGGGASVTSGGIGLGKIAVGVFLLASVVGTITWYSLKEDGNTNDEQVNPVLSELEQPKTDIEESNTIEEKVEEATQEVEETSVHENIEPEENLTQKEEDKQEIQNTSTDTESVTITKPEIRKPDIISDFDNDEAGEEDAISLESGLGTKEEGSMPTIDVDVDNTKKKYDFHYQLKDGRLTLYGAFDKGLYEILEFNTESGQNVFLYYKDEYFALSENGEKITPLVSVKDQDLLKKLTKARSE